MNLKKTPLTFFFGMRRVLWTVPCLLAGLLGCQVMMVTSYDPEMDKTATALQKKMDAFLTKLERHTGLPQTDYGWNTSFYDEYLVELRSLQLRAQSDTESPVIAKQLQLMMDNLQQLRLAHEAGSLSPSTLQDTREVFNEDWQVIIAREMAKRRGD